MSHDRLGEYGGFVDGEFRDVGAETIDVRDPATNDVTATVTSTDGEGVRDAIEACERAASEWEGLDPGERGEILRSVAERIRSDVDRLARTESTEVGRPLGQSKAIVSGTARTFEYCAGLVDKIEGETVPLEGERLDYTVREPLGVTGHVVPWNVPSKLMARSVAPALACGNTAVVKPSPEAPVTVLELAELAVDAGLPPGVLNVVPGGAATGEALTGSDRLDGIVFTGSLPTGKRVMKSAAENVVPVTLELGGKSPSIVFPDADLERAADHTLRVFVYGAGQVCFATTRLFVHEDVYDRFVDLLVDRLDGVSVGPWQEDPDMGPLISREARDRVAEFVADAAEDGARVLAGGEIPREEGNYYAPTLIDNADDDAPISCEEVFGPVVTAYEFSSTSEAVERANDSKYGLYSTVWTEKLARAHRVADAIEAGTVTVNEYPVTAPQAPFGGYKKSGIGREKGQQAARHFTQLKNVVVNLED